MSNIKYFTNGTTGAGHSTKHRKGGGTEKITPNARNRANHAQYVMSAKN